jgi:DNA-binding winged helix-turn-helix (wHTH) protein/tetratricopeptide (TPR) repeat protein
MQSNLPAPPVFRFGQFEADVARGTLRRNGLRVRLAEQPFMALVLLLEHAGETVTREQLREKLWPQDVFVDFDGSLNVIAKKIRQALNDDPANPRFIETIPRHGYRFIAPVAVSVPPFATAKTDALLATPVDGAIADAATPIAHTEEAARLWRHAFPPPSRSKSYVAIAVLLLGVLAVVGWYSRHANNRRTKSVTKAIAAAAVPVRRSVAVLDFHNLSADSTDAWLGPALTEMLRTELGSGETLRMVSGEDIASLHATSPWSAAGSFNAATAGRLGTALDADVLVVGSFVRIARRDGNQLRLDARMQEAKTGEILAEVAEVGSDRDLFQLISRMGGRLRGHLGAGAMDLDPAITAELPADAQTARLYTLGLVRLREFDASSAKELLQQAVAAEPKFPLAHAMLARAWGALGYEQHRRREAKTAFDLSSRLPRIDRLQIEGDYYETLADHERAASAYRALFGLFPDSVDYGLQLITAEMEGQHSGEAKETLMHLRRLPPQSSSDPRIDLAEANIERDTPKKLTLLRSAMAKAQAHGEKLLYARARERECVALIYGPDPQSGRPACEEAYHIFLAAGNRLEAADSLRAIGDGEGTAGHLSDAVATYQQALGILENMGEHEKTATILNNMAIAYENQGELGRAEQLYRQAWQHFDKAGDAANAATPRGNIADILFEKGDLRAAKALYLKILNSPSSEDASQLGYPNYRLASLLLLQGSLKDARHHVEEAIADFRPGGANYEYLSEAMIVRGDVRMAAADLEGARQDYNEALTMLKRIGANNLVSEAQIALARLAIEERRFAEAEELLRQATSQLEGESAKVSASEAARMLAMALQEEGKLDDAAATLHRAEALRGNYPDPWLRLENSLEEARLDLAIAKHGQAVRNSALRQMTRVRSAVEEAHRFGYFQTEYEARLVLAEIETAAGREDASADLRAIEAETRARGYERLARKAAVERADMH